MLAAAGRVEEKGGWFSKVRVDFTWVRVWDARVSDPYSKAYNNFAQGTIGYALHDSEASRWKPSLAFTRTNGTDRLANQPYKLNNYFGLQVSYGLKLDSKG